MNLLYNIIYVMYILLYNFFYEKVHLLHALSDHMVFQCNHFDEIQNLQSSKVLAQSYSFDF